MAYVRCWGCGDQIEVPDELYPPAYEGEIPLDEPYYCDACDNEDDYDPDDYDPAENYAPCTCALCHCMNETKYGVTCDNCLAGEHQG